MKIAIFGGTSGTQYLAKRLASEESVKLVQHHNAHPTTQNIKNYTVLDVGLHGTLEEKRTRSLNLLNTLDADLVITTTLNYQLWDKFREKVIDNNVTALLPDKNIAMLEWSKVVGKEILVSANVPTPAYTTYTRTDLFDKFFDIPRPFVLKYDKDWRGGMQTIIITDENCQLEYEKLTTVGVKKYTPIHGTEVENFVIEEFVQGTHEYSYHALIGKQNWIYLGSARDYKRRYENDIGYNTVGLGAYSPVDIDPVVHQYVDNILNLLKSRNIEYIGFLYLGVQKGEDGITRILEINVRPGCPEFTTILPLINSSISDQLYNAVTGDKLIPVEYNNEHAVTVRLINKNYLLERRYDWKYPVLDNVPEGIEIVYGEEWYLLHAVLVACGKTRQEAADKIHAYLKTVDLGDYTYRTDIGYLE
jgi:phosphoribosylamine--glycine ligase